VVEPAIKAGAGPPTPDLALRLAVQALKCDRITVEVVAAFDAAAIPYILLKGPSIARWLYPSGGRSYCDTDLLVPADEFDRAERVIRSMGFVGRKDEFHPLERNVVPEETALVRPEGSDLGPVGVVDLHRNLSSLPFSDSVLWNAFSADTELIPIAGVNVRVLGRTALALHIVQHAVHHGFGFHTDEDLRRAIAVMSLDDWRPVVDLAKELGISDVLGFGLRRNETGAEIADLLELPSLVLADSAYWALGSPRGVTAVSEFLSASTYRERLRRLRWSLFPSPARLRSVSGRPDARGVALLAVYVSEWANMASGFLPAVRFARDRRRQIDSQKSAG